MKLSPEEINSTLNHSYPQSKPLLMREQRCSNCGKPAQTLMTRDKLCCKCYKYYTNHKGEGSKEDTLIKAKEIYSEVEPGKRVKYGKVSRYKPAERRPIVKPGPKRSDLRAIQQSLTKAARNIEKIAQALATLMEESR